MNSRNKIILKNLLPGIYLTSVLFASYTLGSNFNNPIPFISFFFGLGLLLIIVSKTYLFTARVYLLNLNVYRQKIEIDKMFKSLMFTYTINFIGVIVMTVLIDTAGLSNETSNLLDKVISTKLSTSYHSLLIKGVLCNFFITSGVYLYNNASIQKNMILEKVIVLFGFVSMFILLKLEHSVVNMSLLTYSIINGKPNISTMIVKLFIVSIGNVIGGCLMAYIHQILEKDE